MTCDQIQTHLSDYLDAGDDSVPRAGIEAHLKDCSACTEHLDDLRLLVRMLHDRKAPDAPSDLLGRIHDRLAAEPKPLDRGFFARLGSHVNWPSLAAGAVAAGLLVVLGTVVLRSQTPLPTIQTAAVSVAAPTAVDIGFDVDRDVNDVTFTIDLPKGLQFLDANNQPINAQSVSWQGSLKRGKTVVPITVRGVQPGRYEILATVRKNEFAKATKIVLPVDGHVRSVPLSSLPLQEG